MKSKITNFGVLALTIVSLNLTGCGNTLGGGKSKRLPASNQQALQNSSGGSAYQCPAGFNAAPIEDPLTGAGYYQVCRKNGTASEFSVWGNTMTSSTVCLYPAERTASTGAFNLKTNLQNNTPVVECTALLGYENPVPTPDHVSSSLFPYANFTHFFVIESAYVAGFERCMGYRDRWGQPADPSLCPSPYRNSGIMSLVDLTQLLNQ